MPTATPARDHLDAGRDALARGAWEQARAAFDAALALDESAEAWEGLSWAAWWLDDVALCLDGRERAYRIYRGGGDDRGAARMALWVGDDHLEFHGEAAVANGWFQRAERILEELEPCAEHGWLAAFRAHLVLGHDPVAAQRLGGRRARSAPGSAWSTSRCSAWRPRGWRSSTRATSAPACPVLTRRLPPRSAASISS